MRVVLKKDHDSTLEWHEWWIPAMYGATNGFVRADVNGRISPRMMKPDWIKIKCNEPDCPAWALVSVEDLLAHINSVLPTPTDGVDQ